MPLGMGDPRDLKRYALLAQAGMEMVIPLVVGVFADRYLGTTPWLTLIGVVVGFVGGLAHMIVIVNKLNKESSSEPPRESP